MGSKPRPPRLGPPDEAVERVLLDAAEALGPHCMDSCPTDYIVPDGWCLVCRCYAARTRLIAEKHRARGGP